MKVNALLKELQERGIRVWADGEQLHCNAPAAEFTAPLRELLVQSKNDILAFLRSATELKSRPRAIVPLQPGGSLAPIFGVPGHNGDVFCYRFLARHLGNDQPFFGLQPPGLDEHTQPLGRIEDLGRYFAEQVIAFRRDGPCVIAGFCAGGAAAFETARQLRLVGARVECVALFGTPHPAYYRLRVRLRERLHSQCQHLLKHLGALLRLPVLEAPDYLIRKIGERSARIDAEGPHHPEEVLQLRTRVGRVTMKAAGRYRPSQSAVRLRLFLPNPDWAQTSCDPLRWQSIADRCQVQSGPSGCTGENMLREPYASVFAHLYREPGA